MCNTFVGKAIKVDGKTYTKLVTDSYVKIGFLPKPFIRELIKRNNNLGDHWIIIVEEYVNSYLGYALITKGLSKINSYEDLLLRKSEYIKKSTKNKEYLTFESLGVKYIPSEILNYSFINTPVLVIDKKIQFITETSARFEIENIEKIHSSFNNKLSLANYKIINSSKKSLGKKINY